MVQQMAGELLSAEDRGVHSVMIRAAGITLEVSVLALALSVFVGVSRRWIHRDGPLETGRVRRASTWSSATRSVPLLVLTVFFAYYAVPLVTNLSVRPMRRRPARLPSMVGRIWRRWYAGTSSRSPADSGKPRALGLRYPAIMRMVVLPQAIRAGFRPE